MAIGHLRCSSALSALCGRMIKHYFHFPSVHLQSFNFHSGFPIYNLLTQFQLILYLPILHKTSQLSIVYTKYMHTSTCMPTRSDHLHTITPMAILPITLVISSITITNKDSTQNPDIVPYGHIHFKGPTVNLWSPEYCLCTLLHRHDCTH